MQADAACGALLRTLRDEPGTGTVHSVFDHAVNIEFGKELVSLLSAGRSLQPFSARLAAPVRFPSLGWAKGLRVRLSPTEIAPEGVSAVALADTKQINLSISDALAGKQDCSRSFPRPEPLIAVLTEIGETNGLSNLVTGLGTNPYAALIGPRLPCLYAAVERGDMAAAKTAAARIAGCGVGLTPSSDDLLTGYLSVLHALSAVDGNGQRSRIAAGIACAAAQKTNRISGAFLLQSGRGLVSEDVLTLLKDLFSNSDAGRITAAARRVAAFGSTSGTDTLTGIVLAIIHHNGGKNSG